MKLTGNRIAIRILSQETVKGGIFIPESVQLHKHMQYGQVVASSNDEFKPGDKLYLQMPNHVMLGLSFMHEGELLFILNPNDVFGKYTGDEVSFETFTPAGKYVLMSVKSPTEAGGIQLPQTGYDYGQMLTITVEKTGPGVTVVKPGQVVVPDRTRMDKIGFGGSAVYGIAAESFIYGIISED